MNSREDPVKSKHPFDLAQGKRGDEFTGILLKIFLIKLRLRWIPIINLISATL